MTMLPDDTVQIETAGGEKRLRLAGNRLYVRQRWNADQGGIALPEKSREGSNWCDVLAVGPECDSGILPGDCVLVPSNSRGIERVYVRSKVRLPDGTVAEQMCDFIIDADIAIAVLDGGG